jgi:phage recombination protein Bet
MNTSIATVPAAAVAPRLMFSPAQEQIIRRSFLAGASDEEAAVLLEVARLRNLNPITRQIHFVKRSTWNPETRAREDVWAFQVSIDGLRALAERTGEYEGTDEPETVEDARGLPLVSRVRVWRRGRTRPFVGVARFAEYAQTKADGSLTKMWKEKPFLMLEKCAEALALRRAFPEDLGSLLEPAELESDERAPGAAPAVAMLAQTPAAALPSTPAIDDAAELAGLALALESCADPRSLAKVVATIADTFAAGNLSPASRATLLDQYKHRRAALKAAKAKQEDADAGPGPGDKGYRAPPLPPYTGPTTATIPAEPEPAEQEALP